MKVAVIGSRSLTLDVSAYIPENCTTIVSGGAKGIDTCAAEHAKANGLRLIECLPNYEQFKKDAPLRRNDRIIELADLVLAFWDGRSHGTKYVIDKCAARKKPCRVFLVKDGKVAAP